MAAKTLFASDIEANMNVDSAFLVRNVERKMTKPNKFGDSKPFLVARTRRPYGRRHGSRLVGEYAVCRERPRSKTQSCR